MHTFAVATEEWVTLALVPVLAYFGYLGHRWEHYRIYTATRHAIRDELKRGPRARSMTRSLYPRRRAR